MRHTDKLIFKVIINIKYILGFVPFLYGTLI